MLYLKLFVCLIVIICFIIYYRRSKEGFDQPSPAQTIQNAYKSALNIQSEHKFTNIYFHNTSEVELIIEYDDDNLTDEILRHTYERLDNNDKLLKGWFSIFDSANNPTITLNGNELIQITKIPPTICGNDFIFSLSLPFNNIDYRYIRREYMSAINNYFNAPVSNTKLFIHTDSNQQKRVYVIISNNDINTLKNRFNSFVNDYADSIPSIICPQETTTTRPTELIQSLATSPPPDISEPTTYEITSVDDIDLPDLGDLDF